MLPPSVLSLMSRQHALLATYQLRALVPGEDQRHRLLRHPDLERLSHRVVRHRAAPRSGTAHVLAPVLDAGADAFLFARTGAAWFGFLRSARPEVEVGLPRRRLPAAPLGQLHVIRHLHDVDVTRHFDVPIARPERILLWLAGVHTQRHDVDVAVAKVGPMLDQAWRQGLVDGPYLHDLVARSGGKGRAGIVAMRTLLAARPPDYLPTGSKLEARWFDLVPAEDRPHLERQSRVETSGPTRFADYRDRRINLVHEVHGEVWHTSLTDRAADEQRYRELNEAGLHVVVWWERDVWSRSREIPDMFRRLRAHGPGPVPRVHRPTPAPWEGAPTARAR